MIFIAALQRMNDKEGDGEEKKRNKKPELYLYKRYFFYAIRNRVFKKIYAMIFCVGFCLRYFRFFGWENCICYSV